MINSSKNKNTFLSIPMNLETLVHEDNIARDIVQFVNLFDLSIIEKTYSSNMGRRGYSIYDMFAMIIYGYSQGIYSTRALEKQCKENVVFMWIMDLNQPDHSTIHNFQRRIVGSEKSLSAQQLNILLKEQLINLDDISIDGTKIKSVANKYTNVYRGTVGYHERNLEEKIAKAIKSASLASENISSLMDDSNDENDEDSSTPINIPDSIKEIADIKVNDPSQLASKNLNKKYVSQIDLKKMDELKVWLESFSKEELALVPELKELSKNIDKYCIRKDKYSSQRDILQERNSYSKTDTDAVFMKMKNDSFDSKILSPGYNIQQANSNGFIIATSVSNIVSDTRQLPDFVNQLIDIGAMKNNTTLLADAGYGSLENYRFLQEKSINYLIPYMSQKYEISAKFKKNLVNRYNYTILDDVIICPAGKTMEYSRSYNTTSPSGFKTYKKVFVTDQCAGCKFNEICSKNGKTRSFIYDEQWEKEKFLQRAIFSEDVNKQHYKVRTIVEHGFANIKYNNKLERFRNYGIKMNSVILQLITMTCNIKRIHNRSMLLKISKYTKKMATSDFKFRYHHFLFSC